MQSVQLWRQIMYVGPHHLVATLKDCVAVMGGARRCCVAREMTKMHEEFWRGTLDEALAEFSARRVRGEVYMFPLIRKRCVL
jgi:16S rRNA (cytidine1402-2'-O)-methyltransferase